MKIELSKQNLIKWIDRYAQPIIVLQAGAATLGSLIFSELLHQPPCNLCWYQRIFMYPLFIVALWSPRKASRSQLIYQLALAIPGGFLATYHYIMQQTGWGKELTGCSLEASCSDIGWNIGGFITIPFLSMIGFIVILLANSWLLYRSKQTNENHLS